MFSPFAWCFHNKIDDGYERFAVVSEYFGRGLFNKLTVVTEPPEAAPSPPAAVPAPTPTPAPAQTYGPGAEAKLRLQEGQSKQVYLQNTSKQVAPKGTTVIPVPEGRMRLIEKQQYASSLEANISKLEPQVHRSPQVSPLVPRKTEQKVSPKISPKISAAITNNSKNPFEETYDESKNPFADVSNNPFSEDEDYDKNLNPFA